jgi:crotonobetainyl-CoA:carnitine CoA-transferase CaiB-like acyl-CoA transferase
MRVSRRMLSAYRVLDISDDKGTVCGQILAQLGADVIKIEAPGGSPERLKGPFVGDVFHQERSLFWLTFNRGKRSITLHLESESGKEIFKKLVSKADIVVESFSPRYMDSISLGYSTLKEINPGIIVVSVSPFGQTGPYRDYKGSDMVINALSGFMYLCGDPDRTPVRVSYPLAYNYAGAQGAVGSLIALYARELTGKGQYVDVSAQEGMSEYTLMAPLFWNILGKINMRSGQLRGGSSRRTREIWQCKDGWVTFGIYGGQLGGRVNKELAMWMDSEGMANDFIRSIDWEMLDMAAVSQEYIENIEKALEIFFMSHTMAELYDGAIERKINLCPIWTPREILSSVQLNARGFWEQVKHEELGTSYSYPGNFFKSTAMPPSDVGKRAPRLGEHNNEIYQDELGLSVSEISHLKEKEII